MSLNIYTSETKIAIGKRLLKYRELLGFTKSEFSSLLGLSPSTISNIEKGAGVSINTILTYSFNSKLDSGEFVNTKIKFSQNDKLLIKGFEEKIKVNNPFKYKEVLENRKNLTNTIKEILLNTDFFNTPRKVDEIHEYIYTEYKKSYDSSVISKILHNIANERNSQLEIDTTNKKSFKYQRKLLPHLAVKHA
jgi:transcriptional regulator with XRE-family HTH domain